MYIKNDRIIINAYHPLLMTGAWNPKLPTSMVIEWEGLSSEGTRAIRVERGRLLGSDPPWNCNKSIMLHFKLYNKRTKKCYFFKRDYLAESFCQNSPSLMIRVKPNSQWTNKLNFRLTSPIRLQTLLPQQPTRRLQSPDYDESVEIKDQLGLINSHSSTYLPRLIIVIILQESKML